MKILYFAWVRQHVGVAREEVEAPAGVDTVAALLDWLAGRGPGYARAFADRKVIRAAVNQQMVEPHHPVAAGDEIALFPPMTGG